MYSDMEYLIHTDGGSRGNPGPSACAAILYRRMEPAHQWERVDAIRKYLGDKLTNNHAEYQGLLLGVTLAVKHGAKDCELLARADSELMVKQMTGVYRFTNMDLLRIAEFVLLITKDNRINLKLEYVRRELNKDADALVNQALDAQRKIA